MSVERDPQYAATIVAIREARRTVNRSRALAATVRQTVDGLKVAREHQADVLAQARQSSARLADSRLASHRDVAERPQRLEAS